MRFLTNMFSSASPQEVCTALANYKSYLESIREALPSSAYDFASADWHYSGDDHRCPHDSWVESLVISEPSSGDRHEERENAISVRLFGAYHDGYLELSYPGVRAYSLVGAILNKPKTGHGDWLKDEVRLSDNKLVLHEILFSTGSRWLIESRDIEFRWVPKG